MEAVTIVGVAASFFTAISLVPQLLKLYREKKPKNISKGMLGVLLAGLVFWIVYGILKEDAIIVASNTISLGLNVATFVLAYRYEKLSDSSSDPKNVNQLRRHNRSSS